jgi:hypothetical protein
MIKLNLTLQVKKVQEILEGNTFNAKNFYKSIKWLLKKGITPVTIQFYPKNQIYYLKIIKDNLRTDLIKIKKKKNLN